MARAPKVGPPPSAQMSRLDWSLAFERKASELRPGMGRKYLANVIATLWSKHGAEDPDRVAIRWAAEREGHPL